MDAHGTPLPSVWPTELRGRQPGAGVRVGAKHSARRRLQTLSPEARLLRVSLDVASLTVAGAADVPSALSALAALLPGAL